MFNLKQTINSAKASAMQSVRDQAKQQGAEWLNTVKKQGEMAATGQVQPEQPKQSPMQEQKPEPLFSNLKEVSPEEAKQLEQQSKIRLQRLEEELQQLRMQRQQQMQQWVKGQQQIMHPEQQEGAQPAPKPIIETSKPKGPSGAQAATQAKKGSKEMGRQKSQ